MKSENNFFSVGEKTRTKEKKEIFGEENIFLANEMEKERIMFRRKTFLCVREEEERGNGREIFR